MKSREVVLKGRIDELPQPSHFELIERDLPDAGSGQLLVRVHHVSLDPYLGQAIRGRHMGEPHPYGGATLPGYGVAEVLVSRDPSFAPGDYVVVQAGWAEYGVVMAAAARKVDPTLGLSVHLGLLGTPGLTAWAGVTQLAKVGPDDVLTVDAAAGAVGGAVGQIARILGARAVGIAGGPDKCALVRDLYGFDACLDYRRDDWQAELAAATAGGPTVHFENVGNSVLLPVFGMLRDYGRVVLCGLAEHYHQEGDKPSIPIGTIMLRRASVHGLIVYDFAPRLAEWVVFARPHIETGRLVEQNDICHGLDAAPEHFAKLLAGRNLGKAIISIVTEATKP